MVPVVGLEPTPCRQERILSPSRLPFHHTGERNVYYTGWVWKIQENSIRISKMNSSLNREKGYTKQGECAIIYTLNYAIFSKGGSLDEADGSDTGTVSADDTVAERLWESAG